jgi:ribosomal protein L37E
MNGNLLSGTKLQEKNVKVELGNTIKLKVKGVTVVEGSLEGQFWKVKLPVIKHEVTYVSKKLLHQRWGHSSENHAKDCKACVFGKSRVKSYDKHNDRTSTKELVHMDLMGPINGTQ